MKVAEIWLDGKMVETLPPTKKQDLCKKCHKMKALNPSPLDLNRFFTAVLQSKKYQAKGE